jgi:hypothetical protein
MPTKIEQEAQNPLILRCHRLMEAFAKSDDERDFYINRGEGFLIYVDLDKTKEELDALNDEIKTHADLYCLIPKLSFYETKKIMESFVNEKVYDIDTKEKLLEIIQSKEARENFLEFIYDHHAEQEKWQLFYQERSRIRIIEWLRLNHFHFVFEEDLELPKQTIEKLKQSLFQPKVTKDVLNARKVLVAKAKTYYSNEALNPRPKRGRPPKQAAKPEIEPQVTMDIYTTVSPAVQPFLFSPDLNLQFPFSAFSSKFESQDLSKKHSISEAESTLAEKLASLRSISKNWLDKPTEEKNVYQIDNNFDDDGDDDDDPFDDLLEEKTKPKKTSNSTNKNKNIKKDKKDSAANKAGKPEKTKVKRIMGNLKKTGKNQGLKKIIP